jgi:hypothetical protein
MTCIQIPGTTSAFALGVVFLFSDAAPAAKADAILVGAPNVGGSFYGMDGVDIAAEFTLSGTESVTTADVVLLGGGGLYDFALQNSLTGTITTFASAVFTVPTAGQNTETMNVDAVLAAGTYYLVGSKNPADTVPGWWVSDGTYITNAGSVANGEWFTSSSTPTSGWTFSGPPTNPGYYAPVFTINGSPVAVPAPLIGRGLPVVLAFGTVLFGAKLLGGSRRS